MTSENVLLLRLAKDCLKLYFSNLTPTQLYRAFNKAVSNYLDMTEEDTTFHYKESDSIYQTEGGE